MTDKNCPSCSLKEKEIKELKLSSVELEKSIKKLKHELKVCNEKYTDAEDSLTREQKLWKRTEDELMELQEIHAYNSENSISSDASCSNSSDESENENGTGRNQHGQEGHQEKFKAEDSRARGVPVTRNPLSLKDQLLKPSGILNEGLSENQMKGRPYRKDKNKMCDPKHHSKSTVDHKRCENESEQNPDLLRALKYLKECGYEESEDDEPRLSPTPESQARPHKQ